MILNNYLKGICCGLALAVCLVRPCAVSADNQTQLVKQEAGYVCYENGGQLVNTWKDIEGVGRYYFKADGYAATLSTEIDGVYYVFDEAGKLILPGDDQIIVTIGKDKYRVDANGQAKQGWYKKKYYFDETGKMVKGWMPGKKYYFDEKNGQVYKGIRIIGNREKLYAFRNNGKYDAAKTKKLRKAAKYKKDFTELRKLLGKPIKTKYFKSCMGPGQDGILKYRYIKVSTYKSPEGKEIYLGVDPK